MSTRRFSEEVSKGRFRPLEKSQNSRVLWCKILLLVFNVLRLFHVDRVGDKWGRLKLAPFRFGMPQTGARGLLGIPDLKKQRLQASGRSPI